MGVNCGSEWGKWDLHVHTPLSFESQFSISEDEREEIDPIPVLDEFHTPDRFDPELWAKYVEELESISHVDCLGITDYFSLEGYELISELRDNGYLDNFDLVLPNIEFRLDTFTGDDRRINLHVIFSDNLSVDDIRHDFLRNLRIRLDQGDEWTLRPESLRELGQRAKEYHGDDLSDYAAGCKYATISLDSIVDELTTTSRFEGEYLILLAGAEWSDIDWDSQDAETRRQLLKQSHGLFSNSPDTLEWATGQKDLSEEEFQDEFGALKPVFAGSDAHDFDSICEPDQERYCWLKANHTFAGLKQVVFEPRDRIEINSSKPQSFTQAQTIRSVSINEGYVNSQLTLDENEIPLNANLVTVIGSQGSGKTALLDLIANCFQDRRGVAVDDDNSFVARIEDAEPLTETSLTFEGLEQFTKRVVDSNPRFVEGADISYIPQGKIVEYCQKGEVLHEQIKELVRGAVDSESATAVGEFKSQEEKINKLTKKLRRLNSELHNINASEVKSELKEKRANLEEEKTALENKKGEIAAFKEEHADTLEGTEVEELQDDIDDLRNQENNLSGLEATIDKAFESLETVATFNEYLEEIQTQSEPFGFEPELESIAIERRVDRLESLQSEITERQESLSEQINDIRDQMQDSTEADEQLSDLREEQRQIKERIASIKKSIGTLENEIERAETLQETRKQTFVEYISACLEQRESYSAITNEFVGRDGDILGDVEFNPQVKLQDGRADDLAEILDLRKVSDEDIEERLHRIREIVSGEPPDDLRTEITAYIDAMEELRENTKSETDHIEFDGLLYDDCLALTEEIYYQETPMSQLSRGQKGTVLLKIYLAEGENPLIIDSPEENLDNRFVYEELIGAIRKAKSNRQIFIATHDANLVVNTDSEQVIISSFEEGQIEFDAGALENSDIRSDAKAILEGGDEAFRRREEKYELSPE